MKRLGVVSALVVIGPLLLVPGGARAADGLSADEQALLTELLGPGVIGAGGTAQARMNLNNNLIVAC